MARDVNRHTETIVYAALWIVVVGLFLLGDLRRNAQMSEPLLDMGMVRSMARAVLPLLALFVINNYVLVPRLILRNKWKAYVAVIACLLAALWCYQYFAFMSHERHAGMPFGHRPPHGSSGPLAPMPVMLDFTFGLVVVGVNLAITLMFQRYYDRLEQESLRKANAENQLAYLKAQINPHFYLNMLNNIHGLIDIDTVKAQAMLIDMSRLMRFMLYDCAKPRITLAQEVAFLENYMGLMRQRYPAKHVEVDWHFPPRQECGDIALPPLLFLSFIENAFKHGVSYRCKSYISAKIEIAGRELRFECANSVADGAEAAPGKEDSGIGLKNVKERLSLLYGDRARLAIDKGKDKYVVQLTIPAYDTENTDN